MPRSLLVTACLLAAIGAAAPSAALAAEPANVTPPVITGGSSPPVVGETLTAGTGTWDAGAVAFSYQWERCAVLGVDCAPIPGAAGAFAGPTASYTLQPADAGRSVRIRVYGSGPGGTGIAASQTTATTGRPPVTTPPVNVTPPSFAFASGSEWVEGSALVGSGGAWDDTYGDYLYAYDWLRCDAAGGACVPVVSSFPRWEPRQKEGHYPLGPGDVGHTIRFQATVLNAKGSTVVASPPSPVVGPRPAPPVNTLPPFLLAGWNQGDPNATFSIPADGVTPRPVGDILTAYAGAWSGATDLTVGWLRCEGDACVPVPGNGFTYVVTKGDTGRTIRAQIFATNAYGTTVVLTGPVPGPKPPPLAQGNPNVFGNPGETREVPDDVIAPRQRSLRTARIRGRVEVKEKGSTVEVAAWSVRAFDRRVRSIRIGRSTQDSVRAGRVRFSIFVTSRYRKALGRRAKVVLRIKVTPPDGKAVTRSRTIVVTR